jgi:DNA-binding transcriptional LysR family regulator
LAATAHFLTLRRVTFDVDGLQALVAVNDHRGFAAAGRALRLSTNAVSHRIALMEARLGQRLFDRTTRNVRATDAGQRLLVRARRILDELELAERDVALGALSGTVRVGLPPDLVEPALLSALELALASSPGLRLELLGRAAPVDPRKEGLDIVVWGGPRIPVELVARPLAPIEWSLCASAAYAARARLPATPQELAEHRCLLARNPTVEREWRLVDAAGVEVAVAVRGPLESDDPTILQGALRHGLGIGVRPKGEVLAAVARGAWVHVLPGWGFRPIPVSIVTPRGRLRSPGVRLVADTIASALAALAGRDAASHDM